LGADGFHVVDALNTVPGTATRPGKMGVAPAAVALRAGLPLVIGVLGARGLLRLRRKS